MSLSNHLGDEQGTHGEHNEKAAIAEGGSYVALYVTAWKKRPGAYYGEMQARMHSVIEAAQPLAVSLAQRSPVQCRAGQPH